MPTPDSANEIGRMAGSAAGASKRTAMWATRNAAKMPRGTPRVLKESSCPPVTTIMAKSTMTMGEAMSRSISSMLRLSLIHI